MTVDYSNYPFKVIEHVIPATHVREYPHAVLDDNCSLSLSVKQYIPKNYQTPTAGDVTFIVSPGIGLVKVSSSISPLIYNMVFV